ncbi:hypothetical protein C0J52_09234 [Blattella germanica]|nr:hypothetical protein C0J52_09234 [Blattella germanica]
MEENSTERNERTGQFEMLKALYDFKATFAKTLSFKENDIFILHQISTKQRNWWQVVNSSGQVGYVPSNYVTTIQVSPEYWIQFLDRCLEILREEGTRVGGCLAPDRQDLLMRLVDRRREAESCVGKRRAPLPPDFSAAASPHHSVISDNIPQSQSSYASSSTLRPDGDGKVVNESPAKQSHKSRHSKSGSKPAKQVIHITMSDTTHCHVNSVIEDSAKTTPPSTEKTSSPENNENKTDPGSPVAYNLVEQTNADASISRHVMAGDKYNGVSTLIQYYQMEVRWSIRQLLLQAFGIMCSLDAVVVTLMLNSILPMELARDMRTNPENISRLNYSSLLLTMIFSMGESMPVTHVEHLGVEFLTFLFEFIENPPETDVNEQIPDLFLNLVLAYNLQFTSSADNIMLNALLERSIAKTFTEKILLLLNREEDPVRIFEHQPAPPHSVLKLFVDLFSNPQTATLFYTNDTKVLIDIIDDILKCFTRIFCEESEQSKFDQQLVREISNEFPQYFKS